MNIGETEVPPSVLVRQPLVVEAEQVQHGGVEVVEVDLVLLRVEAVIVSRTVADARLHATASKEIREVMRVVVATSFPLYLADVHLHRARLFKDKAELAKAAEIICRVSYGSRYEELADAEEAVKDRQSKG